MQARKASNARKTKKVDPVTGEPSTAPNAISQSAFRDRQKVDPETGKPSNAQNAITYGAFKKRQKVDPLTGEPSTAPNAISKSAFKHRQKVDPETGEISNAPNAITKSTFRARQKVDPDTGKPSTAANAISRYEFRDKQKVDPETGAPSKALNAITYAAFIKRQKVDPETGELSEQPNAISRSAFKSRQKVDPETGEPSNAPNAISRSAFQHRQKVDPETGELSTEPNAISRSTFKSRKKVDPETGEPSTKPDAISYAVFQNRKKVDPETGELSNAPNAISYVVYMKRERKKRKISDNIDIHERPTAKKRKLSKLKENTNMNGQDRIEAETMMSETISNEEMSNGAPEISMHSLSIFSNNNGNIKADPLPSVYLRSIIQAIQEAVKQARNGNNVQDNCGYLTEYTIRSLKDLLQGKAIKSFNVNETSSLDVTPNEVSFRTVAVKDEFGKKRGIQKRIASSTALPYEQGLHANLPNQSYPFFKMRGENEFQEYTYVDLTQSDVTRTRIKADQLTQHLKDLALSKQQTLIGQVAFARNGQHPVGHVIAFCATSTGDVFYVDGHFYNGLEKTGSPLFTDLTAAYQFISEANPKGPGEYIDDVFYLTHHELKVKFVDDNVNALNSAPNFSPN